MLMGSILLAVAEEDVAGVVVGKPTSELLGTIDGAMLASGATEKDLEGGEVTLEVFLDALSHESFGMEEKLVDSGLFLEEFYDGAVLTGIGLVFRIATGVGQGTAVEEESTAVAGGVGGEAELVAEAADGDSELVSGNR